MSRASDVRAHLTKSGGSWENEDGPSGATNTSPGLTHSLDLGEEGLAMQATRTCSVDGCDRPRRKREWCEKHYARWRTHGDPNIGRVYPVCVVDGCSIRATTRSPICTAHQRAADASGPHGLPLYFADKIAFGADDGCWTWLRHVNSAGYGYVSWLGRLQPAHRVAYTLLVGPIPDGLHIDHVCRNRLCVNPAHLEVVTQRENNRRANVIGPEGVRATCRRGHDWRIYPPRVTHRSSGKTSRTCSECARQRHDRRRSA